MVPKLTDKFGILALNLTPHGTFSNRCLLAAPHVGVCNTFRFPGAADPTQLSDVGNVQHFKTNQQKHKADQ